MSIKPKLGLFDLTMIAVSLVIGMGIFRTPVEVAQKAQIPFIFFAAWIVGAISSLCGALTFAEIGSRYPVAGGFYRIFSHCYHPAFAFMVNWMTVISNAGSTAIVAIIGAEYVNPILIPNVDHDLGIKITTISAIAILYLINLLGIKMSARALNVLMIIKIVLIAMLISCLFFAPTSPSSSGAVHVSSQQELSILDLLKAFWLCFVPVFFTYGGYQQSINFGNDVPNASRTMPRAIIYGIAIILILYLLANFSFFRVLGFEGLKTSTTLAADVARVILGDSASKIIAVIMFLSVMAYVNASILSNPRVYYAMAEERVLPPIFKQLNERTQVQEFGVTVFVGFMIVTLFLTASFSKVLNYVMFFDSIAMVTASASIFVLRHRAKREGNKEGIYIMKGYPWMPLIFMATYTLVNISVMVSNPGGSLIGFILFISGLPLYWGLKKLVDKVN